MKFLMLIAVFLVPGLVLAQTLPDPGSDGFVDFLIDAVSRGDYRYAAVLAVIGLTFLARTYGSRLPGALGEFFTSSRGGAILALLLALLTGLAPPLLGWVPWSVRVVFDALMAGFAAIGGWTGARRLFGVVPAPAQEVTDVPAGGAGGGSLANSTTLAMK